MWWSVVVYNSFCWLKIKVDVKLLIPIVYHKLDGLLPHNTYIVGRVRHGVYEAAIERDQSR